MRAPSLPTALIVGAGGVVGTLLRFGVGEIAGSSAAATLTVNLLGAFALGILLGWARARDTPGAHLPRIRVAQTFFGTGMLGGFTTYSALALEVIELPLWQGAGYGLLTVIAGVLLAAAGVVLGRRVAR